MGIFSGSKEKREKKAEDRLKASAFYEISRLDYEVVYGDFGVLSNLEKDQAFNSDLYDDRVKENLEANYSDEELGKFVGSAMKNTVKTVLKRSSGTGVDDLRNMKAIPKEMLDLLGPKTILEIEKLSKVFSETGYTVDSLTSADLEKVRIEIYPSRDEFLTAKGAEMGKILGEILPAIGLSKRNHILSGGGTERDADIGSAVMSEYLKVILETGREGLAERTFPL